jgi:hypothetical protein
MIRPLAIPFLVIAASLAVVRATHVSAGDDDPQPAAQVAKPKFTTRSLRGKVVFLAEAMKRLHGVQTTPTRWQVVALKRPTGSWS